MGILFPDECRICQAPLTEIARYPVCRHCLESVEPYAADYFCVSCRTPFLNEHPLDELGRCALCRHGLHGFDAAYSYGYYDGTLRRLIHLFKYERIHTLGIPLGNLMARALPLEAPFDLVAPMPLHWWRRWRRGFNQAMLLARQISRRTGLPVAPVLKRGRATRVQAGLSGPERRRNVAGAFTVRRPGQIEGRSVLLVDDVMTTAATANAAARALKRAGAARVTVLTLARADRRHWASSLAVVEPDSAAVGAS